MQIYIAKCSTCGKEFHTTIPDDSEAFAELCCARSAPPQICKSEIATEEAPLEVRLAEAVIDWWNEHKYDVTGDRGTFNLYEDAPPFVELAEQLIAETDCK